MNNTFERFLSVLCFNITWLQVCEFQKIISSRNLTRHFFDWLSFDCILQAITSVGTDQGFKAGTYISEIYAKGQ